MEIILNVLQGSYAYLLVFQILVITLLVLSLIWLVAKRTQEAHTESAGVTATAAAPTTIIRTDPALEAKMAELEHKLSIADEENKGLKAASGDSRSLREKVKYLESKLLEYEILQEEIGTLSALKLENEHLKQELIQSKGPEARSAAPVPPMEAPPPDLPANALMFDAPATAPATPSDDLKVGENATAGLESLLAQIDDIAGPPSDKS